MKNKKYLILFSLVFFFTITAFSQENKIAATVDFGGNSGFYSFNGELALLSKDMYSINARVGVGYMPINKTEFVAIPLGINIVKGKGKHHLEGGLGFSFIQGLTFKPIEMEESKDYYPDKGLYFVPSLGYRFDKLTKGLILKVYYSPLIVIHDFFDEGEFIDEVTQDVIVSGETTKREWFDNFYGDNFLPKATNQFGYFGISIGYRF